MYSFFLFKRAFKIGQGKCQLASISNPKGEKKKILWNGGNLELKTLTSIVMAHSNIVSDHVSHRSGQQMRFVHIYIDTDANGFRCAHGIWHSHTSFTTHERFTARKSMEK